MPPLFTPPAGVMAGTPTGCFKTGRSRSVTVSGSGTFALDPDIATLSDTGAAFNGHGGGDPSPSTTTVNCFGGSFSASAVISSIGDGFGNLNVQAILTMTWTLPGQTLQTQVFNGAISTGPAWAGSAYFDGTGTFSFSVSATLSEAIGQEPAWGEDVPFETLLITGVSFTATFNGTEGVWTGPGSPISCTVTGTPSITPPAAELAMIYGHQFTFNNPGFNHALTGTVSYSDASLSSTYGSHSATGCFWQLAGADAQTATLSWTGNNSSDVYFHHNPRSPYVPGGSGLAGDLWTNGDLGFYPHCTVVASPSWALQATVKPYNYAGTVGGNPYVTTEIRHASKSRGLEPRYLLTPKYLGCVGTPPSFRDDLIATFFSDDGAGHLTSYRYPSSGFWHSIQTRVPEGGQIDTTGQAYWVAAWSNQLTGESGFVDQKTRAVIVVDFTNPHWTFPSGSRTTGEVAVFDSWGNQINHAFEPKREWGDTYGTYIRSKKARTTYRPHPELLEANICQDPFTQATIRFDGSHFFRLFNAGSHWASSYYPSANVTIHGTGPLVVEATALPAMVGSFNGATFLKVLRHFGYRYAKLTAKGSVDGMQIRFCIGTFSTAPTYAWEITLGLTGVDTVVELDLAQPTQVRTAGVSGAPITWGAMTALVEPLTFFDPLLITAGGVGVWIEVRTAGTVTITSLEGYFKTTGTRKPIRWYWPLEGGEDFNLAAGPDLGSYDSDTPIQAPDNPTAGQVGARENQATIEDNLIDDRPLMGRYVANGVRGFDLRCPMWKWQEICQGSPSDWTQTFVTGTPYWTIGAYWDRVKVILDDGTSGSGDTGIHVVPTTDPAYRLRRMIANQDYTQPRLLDPFVFEATPDVQWPILGQLRTHLRGSPRGYPGMGDILDPGSGYNALVKYTFEWIWNGERIGCVPAWTPGTGSVSLYDDDTGTLIGTGSIDDDGFWSVGAKYGVVFPLDNVTRTKQYTPTTNVKPLTYTTLGKLLNAYWIKGDIGGAVDGSGYLTVTYNAGTPEERTERRDIEILDRFPGWTQLPGPAKPGMDVAASVTAVHISRIEAGGVVVRNLRDQGARSDEIGIDDAPGGDTIPTVAVDRFDNLYCAFHTAGSAVRIHRSQDAGFSFDFWSSPVSSVKHPRMVFALGGTYLAAHDGAVLQVYSSLDYFQTVTAISTVAIASQLAGFFADRRGFLHVVYIDGGDVKQRISEDGITWRAAVTLRASVLYPTGGAAVPACYVPVWSGGGLMLQATDSGYEQPEGSLIDTGLTFTPQYVGIVADSRDNLWLATATGAYSQDYGQNVIELT